MGGASSINTGEQVMSRRHRHYGWPACAVALAVVPAFPGQATRWYALLVMVATCAGAVLHAVTAVRGRGRTRRLWSLSATALACWAFAEVSVGFPRCSPAWRRVGARWPPSSTSVR
jgi:hypothetical protein